MIEKKKERKATEEMLKSAQIRFQIKQKESILFSKICLECMPTDWELSREKDKKDTKQALETELTSIDKISYKVSTFEGVLTLLFNHDPCNFIKYK